MKSVAFDHFPRVKADSNRFWLFNPILKKRYENRPEERVRLKWVDYVLHQTDWNKSRIGFETPVKVPQEKNSLRADLVLYSKEMEPTLLIECKSDSVKLNQSAAEQAARYNSKVKAEYVVLTNGIEDFWFQKKENKIHASENFFDESSSLSNQERNFEYWQQRGFCSPKSDSEVRGWVVSALNTFWADEDIGNRRYLDFQESVLPVPMNHYYNVFEMDSEYRLAMTFIGTDSSDTFLVGILNAKGSNKGIFSLNLDKLHKNEKESVILFKEGEKNGITLQKKLFFTFEDLYGDQIKNLPQTIMIFFD